MRRRNHQHEIGCRVLAEMERCYPCPLSVADLALLFGVTPRQMRWELEHAAYVLAMRVRAEGNRDAWLADDASHRTTAEPTSEHSRRNAELRHEAASESDDTRAVTSWADTFDVKVGGECGRV